MPNAASCDALSPPVAFNGNKTKTTTSTTTSGDDPLKLVAENSNDDRDDTFLLCGRDGEVFCDLWPFKDANDNARDLRVETASRSTDLTTVTRKEINSLSLEEGDRFVAAVKKLMRNNPPHEPETSEWFRIAGYHGWPSDYCSHGEETFPSWHRAYLLEMETAIRKADRELGNDGNIGLPYWDWIKNPFFPPIIRRYFSKLPPNFFRPGSAGASIGLDRRNTDEVIELNLRNANLKQRVEACLSVDEHWKHASTRWRLGSSLETPHNSVHVAIGYPMSTVAHAAFDPVFWLHHANVDRIHETYLRRHSDSLREFEATQRRLAQERREEDRFSNWLDPFSHPKTGERFRPKDSFDIRDLFYRYGDMPSALEEVTTRGLNFCGLEKALEEVKPDSSTGRKVLCMFRDINVLSLEKKSYMLYVLLFPTEEIASNWDPRYMI